MKIFILFYLVTIIICQKLYNKMNEEENLMKATISSLNKINDILYTINYQNDYYLEEIIDKEIQNFEDIKKFVQKNLDLI